MDEHTWTADEDGTLSRTSGPWYFEIAEDPRHGAMLTIFRDGQQFGRTGHPNVFDLIRQAHSREVA